MVMHAKIKEPINPEIVLFGLILVNFGPLNILPTINPPISDAIHPKSSVKIIILRIKKFVKYKKIKQYKKTYIMKRVLNVNLDILFFKILFNKLKNSNIENTPNKIKQ